MAGFIKYLEEFSQPFNQQFREDVIDREQSEFMEKLVASLMEKFDLNMDQAIQRLQKYIKSLGY